MVSRNYAFPLATDLIMAHLAEIGPATIQELITETGKTRDTVRKAINRLHADKRIFIKDWPYQGIQRSRLWAVRTGSQPDAKKPEPTPMADHYAKWREKHKGKLKAKRSMRVAAGNPFAMLMR